MLFLLCQVATERYAIPANRIVEVLPLVAINRLPQMKPGVAGILHYHGASLLVMDFGMLVSLQPTPTRLSTRVVLLDGLDESGSPRPLGLIAGRATEMLSLAPSAFQVAGESMNTAPFLGPIAWDSRGVVRRVEVDGFATFLRTLQPEVSGLAQP